MKRFAGVLAAALAVAHAPAAAGQRPTASFPISIDSMHVVGAQAELGSILAGRIARDGSVYVVDHLNGQVVAFRSDGRLLWRSGRKGRGPGEFQLPYRLAVKPDGALLVYDFGTGEVTTLSREGRFVSRALLPFNLIAVDNLVALPDGFALSGYSDANARTTRSGVHRFRQSARGVEYVGSFGPLPVVEDAVVLRYWGTGMIAPRASGGLMYARKLPYEVYLYDAAGRLQRQITPPFRLPGRPEDMIRVERSAAGMNVSTTDQRVERPGSLTELGNGWVLVSRARAGPHLWDLYNATGRYAGTREVPADWGALVGYDAARGVLWVTSTRDEGPVLLKLYVSSRGAGASHPPSRAP